MNRRDFMKTAAAAGAAAAATPAHAAAPQPAAPGAVSRPNIILYLADQWRWDFTGCMGLNPSVKTPHIDAMATRGTNFTQAVTVQPVCAPCRSPLFTSRYATETGVWHNGPGMGDKLPTFTEELHKAGYSTNLIGKWHLSPGKAQGGGPGFVPPQWRGGFHDLWEGANALEHTTHPYEGTIWNQDNQEITYKDQYRVDFLTDRTEKFLRQKHDRPFFLFVSQLEPHQQNDLGKMIAPKGFADRYRNAHVPPDLRALPGTWQDQLPEYYGCVEAIDNSVGRIRKILAEENLADNTIFIFMSDHGCHFMTRNTEYKRSAHNASIRVPLIMEGPGCGHGQKVDQIVSVLDYSPTILEMAGVKPAAGMRGRNMLPLIHDQQAREQWSNAQLIQVSESMVGRALRTPEWTYVVADMTGAKAAPSAPVYREYQMYDQRADPVELVNLAGRMEYREQAAVLRKQLHDLIVQSGDPAPTIEPQTLYP